MNEDLLRYGGLVNAKTHLDSKVEALRLENEELLAKIKVLREEGNKISLRIGFIMSHGRKIIQACVKDLETKIIELNKATDSSLQIMKHQSLSIAEQAVKSMQMLDTNTRQQMEYLPEDWSASRILSSH